jgi:stress response protein YsnF
LCVLNKGWIPVISDVRFQNGAGEPIPLVAERARIETRCVERARRDPDAREYRQPVCRCPSRTRRYAIERVPVGRLGYAPAGDRRESFMLIMPGVEEVAVVVKRLRVTEELRITRHQYTTPFQKSVEVRRMVASIARTTFTPTQAKE